MFKFKVMLQTRLIVLCVSILLGGIPHLYPQVQAQELPSAEQSKWITIADGYYGYSFQVPAAWHKEMGVTPDRWVFYSDPTVVTKELSPAALPQGLIKMDFAADPVGHWLPEPEVRDPAIDKRGMATSEELLPLLPPGTWTTVSGQPALIVREKIDDGDGPFVEGTSVIILADRMIYYLWVAYAPPTGTNQEAAARFKTAYDQILSRILNSFVISSPGGQ
ncbi:hypothetical protein [Thermoflexus sp.]|uniref:hypothetical protein n=1 Tax=Thermoflexus sp. TaxID=1969742 RepID=UPI002ADE7E92|nr:hypothetical protein [Thermoflexus sp.]